MTIEDVRELSAQVDAFSTYAQDGAQAGAPKLEVRVPPPALGTERRRSARQTLVARATIRPESNFTGCGPLAAGYVSNISMKGIGLHTRRPLVVGESYQIKLEVGPLKWNSRLRVVSCREHETGTWDVGGEFIANELQVRMPRSVAA